MGLKYNKLFKKLNENSILAYKSADTSYIAIPNLCLPIILDDSVSVNVIENSFNLKPVSSSDINNDNAESKEWDILENGNFNYS